MNKTQKPTPQQLAGVMYQIYPRSFMDSNGDGVGDLRGIISKIDYLKNLGIDSIWLSPIYPSPMADFGYDISDYCNIDPRFGTLEDFDELVAEAKKRNIKIAMDYVVNHTSDQHQWFEESKSSKINPKRDWYIWKNPSEDGGPPNNWLSIFGGSAWEFDEITQQYYLHTFLKEQPDLNWRNPEVVEAMMNVLRFWIERGVDGFRTDAFAHMFKDENMRDEPLNKDWRQDHWEYTKLIHIHTQRHNDLRKAYAYFDAVFEEYPNRDIFMVTEDYAGFDDLNWHYQHSNSDRFAPLNLMFTEIHWSQPTINDFVIKYLSSLDPEFWPNFAMANHDQPRIAKRVGKPNLRIAALLQLTLSGMPIIYYGDEIGMPFVPIPESKRQDPVSFRDPNQEGRDPARTPMQWNALPNAGFSQNEPWLPVAADYKTNNVEVQALDEKSLLHVYKTLITLRKQIPALKSGSFDPHEIGKKDIMSYWRELQTEKLLVLINFSPKAQSINPNIGSYDILYTTDERIKPPKITSRLRLPGHSGVILRAS